MMSKMEIILEKQMVCHQENGLSSNGLSPHGIENIKKKKSYLIFVLTTNHLSVQAIEFFGQHHHLTKTCNPSRELTYDKLFTTLISVHRMTDNKRCVPVHLYYIQLSRTITGKDLISWKDVHTVPEKFRKKSQNDQFVPLSIPR